MASNLDVLIIDNFDSFTFNLVHYIEPMVKSIKVLRINVLQTHDIHKTDAFIISPGPGVPSDYPKLKELILQFSSTKPILGICLGQQAIAEAWGGSLINLPEVWHGIARETIVVADDILFRNVSPLFWSGRYHSWVVDEKNLPPDFIITSRDKQGYIMSLAHKRFPLKSVQFHPESVLTPEGKKILSNWIYWVEKLLHN
ncbi:MAG: anthranilate synthase component II [Bacteroidales bacterium]